MGSLTAWGQLVLDEVGPGRSGPAFWVATHREVRCAVRALVAHGVAAEENPPGITRIGRGCRIHGRGFYRALGAPRDAKGAAGNTRCYCPLKLPVALEAERAVFVYVDPGHQTTTALRS